jgi:hypothetical protein
MRIDIRDGAHHANERRDELNDVAHDSIPPAPARLPSRFGTRGKN